MSALTDVLRDPALQEQNMSPMATPPFMPEHRGMGIHRKKRAAAPVVNPTGDPWGTLGAGLGQMAVNRWGQKDAMGEVMPDQNMAGIISKYLKGKF